MCLWASAKFCLTSRMFPIEKERSPKRPSVQPAQVETPRRAVGHSRHMYSRQPCPRKHESQPCLDIFGPISIVGNLLLRWVLGKQIQRSLGDGYSPPDRHQRGTGRKETFPWTSSPTLSPTPQSQAIDRPVQVGHYGGLRRLTLFIDAMQLPNPTFFAASFTHSYRRMTHIRTLQTVLTTRGGCELNTDSNTRSSGLETSLSSWDRIQFPWKRGLLGLKLWQANDFDGQRRFGVEQAENNNTCFSAASYNNGKSSIKVTSNSYSYWKRKAFLWTEICPLKES